MKPLNFIIGILIILIVALAVYMLFFNQEQTLSGGLSSQSGSSILDTSSEPDISGSHTRIVRILSRVKNIKLDTDIISAPAFTSLVDYTTRLPDPREIGRVNPFAPLGVRIVPTDSQEQETLLIIPDPEDATDEEDEASL